MVLNVEYLVILDARPVNIVLKEKGKITSKSSGFQQSYEPLYDLISAAVTEAMFKMEEIGKVGSEEVHDGDPTEEVNEIPAPIPKNLAKPPKNRMYLPC